MLFTSWPKTNEKRFIKVYYVLLLLLDNLLVIYKCVNRDDVFCWCDFIELLVVIAFSCLRCCNLLLFSVPIRTNGNTSNLEDGKALE